MLWTSRMRSLLLVAGLSLVSACTSSDDTGAPDPRQPDAAVEGGQLCESPPGGCDFLGPECPSLGEVCDGVCGAAAECCSCGDAGQWDVIVYDCPPCP